MNFMELARNRFAVRKFSDKAVEEEKLAHILEVGNLAPTAKNNQPQRIYVLKSEESLKKLAELTHCGYSAGLIFVDENRKNPLEESVHSGVEDVSIVATHIMLAADEVGLATCRCNYFSNSRLEETFNLPKNERAVLIMPIGYAADNVKPTALHTKRKALGDIVKIL